MYYRKILFLLLISISISFVVNAEETKGGRYGVSDAKMVIFEPGTYSGGRYTVEIMEQVPEFNLPSVAEGPSTIVIPVGEIPLPPPEEVEEEEVPIKEKEEKIEVAKEKAPPEEVKEELVEVIPEEYKEEVPPEEVEEELVEVIPEEYKEEVGVIERERVEEIEREIKITPPEIVIVEKKKEEIRKEEEKRLEELKKIERVEARKAVAKRYGKVFIVICLIIILVIFLRFTRKV